ncbi:unnamed protein product [marine sediment metagenome]|uniref:Uncharacterized protein n=1 Tax=marine sediment metagenome TaxID=412755 RepID=X1VQL5_9ZZZZ
MAPEARVFRPKSDEENEIVDEVMKVHTLEGHIQRPSWTMYITYLLNRDIAEIRTRHKSRIRS